MQLTPKFEDSNAVSVLAASEVIDGCFSVRAIDGNNPVQRFYWEVKGIRADVGLLEVEREKQHLSGRTNREGEQVSEPPPASNLVERD